MTGRRARCEAMARRFETRWWSPGDEEKLEMSMSTDPIPQELKSRITRRHFFGECGVGVGKIALASLLCGSSRAFGADAGAAVSAAPGAAANPMAPRASH